MAKRLNVQRLFYFAPYKSVVHQNANIFVRHLGRSMFWSIIPMSCLSGMKRVSRKSGLPAVSAGKGNR